MPHPLGQQRFQVAPARRVGFVAQQAEKDNQGGGVMVVVAGIAPGAAHPEKVIQRFLPGMPNDPFGG
jgi:hypothetical protein